MSELQPMNKYEVKEAIDDAIQKHEARKEGNFVPIYALDLYKKDIEAQIRELDGEIKDIKADAADARDRNRWLFRLVVGAVITSLIPIAIALLSRGGGGILR